MAEVKNEQKPMVEVPDINDERHYTILIELTCKDSDDREVVQTVNVFAKTPEEAFMSTLNLRSLYDQPNVVKVKLVGIYKRTVLKVVEGNTTNE